MMTLFRRHIGASDTDLSLGISNTEHLQYTGACRQKSLRKKESRVWFFYACAMKCKYCDGRKRLRFFLFRRKKKRGGNVEFCANARIVLGNEGRFSLTAHTMLQYHRRTLRLVSAYIEVSHETVACPLTHTHSLC